MARCLLSSLTTHLKNCLVGPFCRPTEKSLFFNTTVNQISLTSNKPPSFYVSLFEPVKTITKYSFKNGKRTTVAGVTDRFFRLHWGAWIRCKAGRKRLLWLKSSQRKNRLRQHVFCNAQQCKMLDTMVSKYWRRPKYYIEDPYAPYHTREYFDLTRKKPWRPEGVDYE